MVTISGTPTASGTFNYTVTLTGGCGNVTANGSITVTPNNIITLSSAAGTDAQTMCINTAITNITYSTTGATGASFSGLPAGVTGNWASNVVTISGAPGASGIFNYTVTLTGGCGSITATGSITVTAAYTITLSSAAGTDAQTICINTAITNITYSTTGATGASFSGLPAGVTGSWASNVVTISGTPTASGTFNYSVTTSGSCAAVTATGTITVTPVASLNLTSGAGSDAQTVCNGSLITNITYDFNNAMGATVTGLPAGVILSPGAGILTISGTPSETGTFTYTITISGGCSSATASGTITVNAQTIVLASGIASPSVCENAPISDIAFTIGGTADNASVTGLPVGITGSLSDNTFTISGIATAAAGDYNYTITTSGTGCIPASFPGTITVQPPAVGGIVSSVSICSGLSGTLTLTGNSNNPVRWEYTTDSTSASWTPIVNTSITQTFTNVTVPTFYRALVANGCGNANSSIATVGIHNYWTGAIDDNWNTAGNWSDNLVPSATFCDDVYIPNTPNKPVLRDAPAATIKNLNILAGAQVTVNATGKLQISGIIDNKGILDVTDGTLEFNGTSQSVSGSILNNKTVKNLIVSSDGTGLTVSNTAGDTLNILGTLSFGNTTADLNTGDNITLKSSITGTANLDKMNAGNVINGDVTVERYIATGTNHPKSWQLLAIPTTGQTIKQSWQEGATATNASSPAPGSPGNPHPGFGTMLSSNVANAQIQPTPGFDAYTSPGPSIKVYDNVTDGYIGPNNTNVTPIYNQKGYFVLVRGDRSVYTSAAAAVPTILRTKGRLFTPLNAPPVTNVLAGKFESVGNPYASALDLRSISKTTQDFFTVWDPKLGGAYGLGGFVTLSFSGGNYVSTPQSPTYGAGPQNFIQSGQAFFVQAFGSNGTVNFKESDKASGSSLVTIAMRDAGFQSELRTNLYGVNANGSPFITDGILIQYSDDYSNFIDGMDARKITNSSENLSTKVTGTLFAIERRHTITQKDTIFLNLSGVRAQGYRFEFIADNLNTGIEGFLEDNYLHTRIPLNMSGSTIVNFTIVNIAGSYAPDRFRIVFAPSIALPVTFTSVKAYLQDKNINVEWRVENELNIKQYEVEKSTNGTQFTSLQIIPATANGRPSAIYVIMDTKPVEGYNYYRVKSIDINGKTAYTNVVKVLMGSLKHDISIYPNPITDGMIHLQFLNQPQGKYGIRLLNKLGQLIMSREINRADGNGTEIIKWDFNLAHGMYQLQVINPHGEVKNINVLY